jgi:hypothetical protein
MYGSMTKMQQPASHDGLFLIIMHYGNESIHTKTQKNNSLYCIVTSGLVIESVRLSPIGYAIPFCKMELLHKPMKVHK